MYDKIIGSLWFTTFFLIFIPIGIYSGQNNKFTYWVLASYMMMEVISDFIQSVTNKYYANKLQEKNSEKH